MNRFIPWVQGKIKKQSINPWPNGILALKGGDLSEELAVDFDGAVAHFRMA